MDCLQLYWLEMEDVNVGNPDQKFNTSALQPEKWVPKKEVHWKLLVSEPKNQPYS